MMSQGLYNRDSFNPISAPDFIPLELLRSLQSKRLRKMVSHAYDHVSLYQERMDEMGVKPDDIQDIADISLLPFTKKDDLRITYPDRLFASPMSEIVRLHASSGTTGKPIVVAYTKEDLQVWEQAVSRALACYGITRGDIIQNAYGYGLFTGGLGLHGGAENLGATVIPISGGNTQRQIMIMRDFNVTAISCTPSYFIHLLDQAQEMGCNLKDLSLKTGIFGAEPWTPAMRQRVEELAGIRAYDIYGLSEIVGPGVAAECVCQDGLHIFEDHFYPEIINPETCEVLPEGEEGELVLTTLSKNAMPMLRYRTRDITSLKTERCACGRTLRRINRISRRSDDMFIIRGVNVFPSQIETALLEAEKRLLHYQIILTRPRGLDQVEVVVELSSDMFDDKVASLEDLRKRLIQAVEHIIGIRVEMTLVQPKTLQRSSGKIQRVIDKRQI